jgi:hypothetical protein
MMTFLDIAWYWFGLVGFLAHLRPLWKRLKKRREIPQLNTDSEYMQKFYSDTPRVDSIKLRP